jgi:amino acid adenylation domain-containing protein
MAEELAALSRREGVTLFMTLLAAFQTLLMRYSGQEDIVVGAPIANRTRPEVEPLIGFFTNTLALRADLSGDPSFLELLGRVREVTLGAFAHQDVPFEKLVEELQPERNPSRSPIFQVVFQLQHPDRTALTLPGLTIEPISTDRSIARFDLSLSVAQTPEGLVAGVEYSTDLFDAQRMERLLGHYRTLLEGIVADPEQRLSHLPLITPAERRQVLIEWNDTAIARPREQSVHAMFEEQVQRTPDAVALEFDSKQLTYAELNRRANGVAHSLRRHGVGLEARVGLCAERSLEMMVGVLGILKAGAAYVPVDPTYPPERVEYMLRDAGVEIVLAYGDVRGSLAAAGVPVLPLGETQASDAPVSAEVPASCAAYALYTSGSTGRPKGVVLSHEALVNLLRWQLQEIPGPARTLQFTSIGFDVSFQEIFTTWCSGGTLVLVSEEARRDLSALRRRVEEAAVERLFVPFAVLRHLVVTLAEGSTTPASLRHVITAGEQLQITAEIRSFFGGASSPTLHNHYGPTEAHVVTAHRLQGDPADWSFLPSIGRPIANVRIYILDGRLQPVPIGVPGELYIGGVCLARGYLNRPDLTAEKFLPNPHSNAPGSRLYRTGDLARYLEDGSIEYLGRIDRQVKIRGFRIEPGEIESVLLAHPQVREAVVVAREDVPGERRLVAYVATGEGEVSAGELRERLREQLPVHMVPSAFVFLEALPLNTNGKVDRRALPIPAVERIAVARAAFEPRTPTERWLVDTWQVHLGIRPVGIRDSFFEIGGESLMAARIFERIARDLGRRLSPATLFQAPTIEALAAILDQIDWTPDWKCLVPIRPNGTKPPFYCVHGARANMLFGETLARHITPEIPFYGLQSLGLDGKHAPLERVEEMAELYVSEIRSVQPNGPYYLGGYSLGGIIALEMAQQLVDQGHKVGMLAMLNSDCPVRSPHFPIRSRVFEQILIPWLLRAEHRYLDLRCQGLRRIVRRQWEALRRTASTMPKKMTPGVRPQPEMSVLDRIILLNVRAEQAYRPRLYPGRITYFYAAERHLRHLSRPDLRLAWSDYAREGLELHLVPGNHGTMRHPPHVSVLAGTLAACLERAQEFHVS